MGGGCSTRARRRATLVSSCGRSCVGDSICGDVIDFDQSVSGERKHGLFFAWWNFCYKSVGGVLTMLTGFLLEAAGFVPNVPQQYATRVAISSMFALLPMAG